MASGGRLRIALVAVADILGYTDAVSRTSTLAQSEIALAHFTNVTNDALAALGRGKPDAGDGSDKIQWHVKTYTDNYLLHTRLREHGEGDLGAALGALGDFQCSMVRNNHLCRGGISLGPTYIDERMIFGRAVVEAYYLEHEIATSPRIVLSNGVARLMARHFSSYGGRPYTSTDYHVLEDADGQWFINYLRNSLIVDEGEHGWMCDNELLTAHRALVANGLERFRSNDRVYPKYRWAAMYHNWFVRVHGLDQWEPTLPIVIEDAYRPRECSAVTDDRIATLMASYRRRIRGNDQDFDDVVRIAARL